MLWDGIGNHDTCSVHPKWSLEEIFFGPKWPCLRGIQRHKFGLPNHPSGCDVRLEWFGEINVT